MKLRTTFPHGRPRPAREGRRREDADPFGDRTPVRAGAQDICTPERPPRLFAAANGLLAAATAAAGLIGAFYLAIARFSSLTATKNDLITRRWVPYPIAAFVGFVVSRCREQRSPKSPNSRRVLGVGG